MSIYNDYPQFDVKDMAVLQDVFSVYWDTVVIAFHEDDGGVGFGLDNVRWIHRCIVHGLMRRSGARCVIVEVPKGKANVARWMEVAMREADKMRSDTRLFFSAF